MAVGKVNVFLLLAALLGALGVLAGFVMGGATGDLLRVILFGGALALVIVATVTRRGRKSC